ncbi:MAG: hypothetical protein M1820_007509 [Bogoriella megaspora]|nr:MAG: hypothetical protein M1820_007509 [Bogoriella megaspora]
MTSMHLYAELLLNIRSITFFASLQTEHNHETRVELSADNETIALSHEGSQASIRLPTKVAGGGAATLTLPPAPSKDITLRLQLEEKEDGLLRIADQESGNITPWAADTLSENATLSCCTCTQPFLLPRRVSTWKDLPSENWAEMMDFWHCHKPNQPVSDSNGNSTSTKGYSASNKLRAIAGIGFVDITQFLLAAGDCIGIEQNEVVLFPNPSNFPPSSP